jgi:hypothetical protein
MVGFGKVGKALLPRVIRQWDQSRIWIIDHNPESLNSQEALAGIRVLGDGPQFLTQNRQWIRDDDWIIPALPVHLAWKWLALNLKSHKPKAAAPPLNWGSLLPYSQTLEDGLLLSFADFVCPDHCPAPLHHCFKTKQKRSQPLWKYLATRPCSKGTLEVIESRQMAPGMGGYPFGELRRVLKRALETGPPFYVATACRCHGVINGLTWG